MKNAARARRVLNRRRAVSPPQGSPGQGLRPLVLAPRIFLNRAGNPPPSCIYSTTSTIYAYDDDGAASPGATEGCGGGVSTGLAACVGGKGGV